jgi:large subunit ribosomal protein L7/L12
MDSMSVMELNDLVKRSKRVRVSAAAVATPAAGGGGGAAAAVVEEKTEFTVMLKAGANKVQVIKAVREITGLGLKEARIWSTAQAGEEGIAKADADAALKLVDAGAKAEVRDGPGRRCRPAPSCSRRDTQVTSSPPQVFSDPTAENRFGRLGCNARVVRQRLVVASHQAGAMPKVASRRLVCPAQGHARRTG